MAALIIIPLAIIMIMAGAGHLLLAALKNQNTKEAAATTAMVGDLMDHTAIHTLAIMAEIITETTTTIITETAITDTTVIDDEENFNNSIANTFECSVS